MIMSEKLSVIGHLAAAVAHEIRNPLTSLKGFVQLMDMTKEVNPLHSDIMLKEIDRINIISSELLVLGKNRMSLSKGLILPTVYNRYSR